MKSNVTSMSQDLFLQVCSCIKYVEYIYFIINDDIG